MGYLNNVTGYRDDLLANRAIVKHGNYALLTPDGLVKNIIPGFENCDVTILSTPKLGASFVDYLVTLHQNGGNQQGFGGEGIETFLYVIAGNIEAKAEGKTFSLTQGGYLYCPPGEMMTFSNAQTEDSQLFYINAAILLSRGMPRGWFPAMPASWSVFIMKAWKMLFCWISCLKSWASI